VLRILIRIFVDFKKDYDSVRRALHNILIEFAIPKKLNGLIRVYICIKSLAEFVAIKSKNLSMRFQFIGGQQKRDALSSLFFFFFF
jgi:hypothetical protein